MTVELGGRHSNQKVSGTLLIHLPSPVNRLELFGPFDRNTNVSRLVVLDTPLTLQKTLRVTWITSTGLFGFWYLPQQLHVRHITFHYMSHLDAE
jgi:hypothetical protein